MTLPPVSVNAFGQFTTGSRAEDSTFLLVMGLVFPPPGVQVGLGFALRRLGGVVGVGHAVDRVALARVVLNGTAGDLLFPPDTATAEQRVPAVLAVFPRSRGRNVIGPMFEATWGHALVSAKLAALIELPDPVRLSVIGSLSVLIPEQAPIVELRAEFLGQFDPVQPSMMITAALTGSRIAGVRLSGEVCLLTRGGRDAAFVLSAGGFHPQFPVPVGVPELRRVAMNLSPSPLMTFRCQAYLALTTNTVQFGARIDFQAQIARCGLSGHLALDVLAQWRPHLAFTAQLHAGVSVRVLGKSLMGVHLDLLLEGPTPWHARGRGSIDLFLFSVSFDFDTTWGSAPPLPQDPVDIGALLTDELEQPRAWATHPPDPALSPVVLTPEANRLLGDGKLVHPQGTMTVRQQIVPLRTEIERFGRESVPPQMWDISAVTLGNGDSDLPTIEVKDRFAPGQFKSLAEDEQLSGGAYRDYPSGRRLTASQLNAPDGKEDELTVEASTLGGALGPDLRVDALHVMVVKIPLVLAKAAEVAAALRADHERWWWRPNGRVTVHTAQPVRPVEAWSLAPLSDGHAGLMMDAMPFHGAVTGTSAPRPGSPVRTIVEAWEVED
ncbi:hypothetical protein STRCI_000028 [Streptomyces cinnabarinus]|uniref:DUF6603 domain-containing protein n=1 Tax=Streptomyces cinnabarinus TaxID=67287 RepID=A0ABY7K801_9ACTN|nr:DUF6603 domain-containing protein [Streptomyces cinnabarinus]WAZ19011.1 hypothetical protein STRCI_000028 [Streptomyces cinnabarinus]